MLASFCRRSDPIRTSSNHCWHGWYGNVYDSSYFCRFVLITFSSTSYSTSHCNGKNVGVDTKLRLFCRRFTLEAKRNLFLDHISHQKYFFQKVSLAHQDIVSFNTFQFHYIE